MEKFLGVLFCGGKGKRLGEITKYISKSFVPVLNKPVFMYGLNLLEKESLINEIVILTNTENNVKLKNLGYKTIIQNDKKVTDMLTGWQYIKKEIKTKKNAILIPSDNISNVNIRKLVNKFNKQNLDFVFSIYNVKKKNKLREMGCFNINEKKYYYKPSIIKNCYGVIAPYVIRNNVKFNSESECINFGNTGYLIHKGYWFDIGDYESIISVNNYLSKNDRRK